MDRAEMCKKKFESQEAQRLAGRQDRANTLSQEEDQKEKEDGAAMSTRDRVAMEIYGTERTYVKGLRTQVGNICINALARTHMQMHTDKETSKNKHTSTDLFVFAGLDRVFCSPNQHVADFLCWCATHVPNAARTRKLVLCYL